MVPPSLPDHLEVPKTGLACRDHFPSATRCRSPLDWSDPRSHRRPPGLGRSFHHRFAVGENTHGFIKIANHESWNTNLGYLHGLCPCRAPSSSSSPKYVRAADRAYCAACISLAPRAISNFSATQTINIQR